ncbi:hypothetical protein AWB77_04816 [Caballeronia fortuita]|uniref:Uncharacterized protein n=1 Tax=Caballeronia fortuita TaxID=1777138 RepID=A0A158D250_9BURK|nr:hypothetical protein [Caballeronia fortuita]SAK88744.1 hypothetical protein AWB77_04816 [Caballeronia fortuita]
MSDLKKVLVSSAEDVDSLSAVFDQLEGMFRAIEMATENLPAEHPRAQMNQIKKLAALGRYVAGDWSNTADCIRQSMCDAAAESAPASKSKEPTHA